MRILMMFCDLRFLVMIFATVAISACGSSPTPMPINISNSATTPARVNVPVHTFELVNTFPHDPQAFTQGLLYHNGFLYEGTGGKHGNEHYSFLRKVDIKTGRSLQQHDLSRDYFGEGIALLNGKIYQITWTEGKAFVYDAETFEPVNEFRYPGQGWGITDDRTNLYMSDGTHIIRVIDPETFKQLRTITVLDEDNRPVTQLNELEWIKGEIWANVWQSGWIMRIDPESGKIVGRIDLRKMVEDEERRNPRADVLNGIAYDEEGDRIFVTGKFWERLFEIKVK